MTSEELQLKIIEWAGEDREFRARLVADPHTAIQQLTGLTIPDVFTVKVHQESPTSFHLVLPPSSQLTEEEMAQVFGGIDWAYR